jgi:hypothetical protein
MAGAKIDNILEILRWGMDNDRQLLSRLAAVCLIAFLAISPIPGLAQPSGDKLALKLRNNVVKITAKRESGESNQGFGFIVGKQHAQFYIVTANHVVRSNRPGGASTSVKVKFYSDPGHSYKADLLETFYGKPQDFAVIQVAVPPNFSWESKALVPPEIITRGLRGEDVWFIGRSGQWYIPAIPGRINSEKPDLHSIIHVDMVSVRVGTSGAPLITKNGIIGMIIQDEVGSARAVSIGAIQAAFDEWRYPWSLQVFLDKIAQPKSQPTVSKPSPPAGTATQAKLPPESTVRKAEPPEQTTDSRYQVGVLPLQLKNDALRFEYIFTQLIEESIKETQFFSEYHYYKMNTKYKTDRSEIIFNKKLMDNLWVKKGFFSKPELNHGFIMQLGKQLEVDAILLFSANVMNMAKDRIKAILVDVKREKIYSSSGLTDFVLTEDTDRTLEARSDTKRITKKVFAEFKSSY